ncbi:sensor histidine kinase [Streptomyces sp. NBC_00878]|uniref:sensor histidine kinase n=1 Tax=Streptomyces sp. NBC_00878 TaxID=2975854 RepID=UPI00225C1EB0|nr:sensor histidine kinase [Streptomyces sp. NBC_00878]MCX4906935.1 sensor histidine kinase [Streptomyces sp. NBC_00878]
MRRPGVWWRAKSTPAKVETYTRWSFYTFPVVEVAAIGLPTFAELGMPLALWLFLPLCGHALVGVRLAARSLDWVGGSRAQPVRLVWVLGAVTALLGITALAVQQHGPVGADAEGAAGGFFIVVLTFGVGNMALGMRSRRRVLALVCGCTASTAAVSVALGMRPSSALGMAAAVLIAGGFIAFTSVFSVWLLKAVLELDAARETRTRLAVAEERLRFGRDLHDVMGRNLAVIALKSELAVQLARRERPEAVDQMIEVQRIAHESQKEVRAVVRGYREADLGAELSGAQGVLTAAGFDCTVTGSPAGLPSAVQSALGWVVREATTNVLRHGDAGYCRVSLRVEGTRVVLTVENDGVERDRVPVTPTSKGSGLAGLRERLSAVDGTLEAGPVDGDRFRVVAEVPLPPAATASSSSSPPLSSFPSPAPRPVNEEVAP